MKAWLKNEVAVSGAPATVLAALAVVGFILGVDPAVVWGSLILSGLARLERIVVAALKVASTQEQGRG